MSNSLTPSQVWELVTGEKLPEEAFIFREESPSEESTSKIEALKIRLEAGGGVELNKNGSGIAITMENLPRIKEEVEKASVGESKYSKATIRRYSRHVKTLEELQEKLATITIQPSAQKMIEQGAVVQWAKQPNLYFVQGLKKVAVELQDDGTFAIPKGRKFLANTEEEKQKVEAVLNGTAQSKKNDPKFTNQQKLRDIAHGKDIVAVAHSLGMELEKTGKNYIWREHDSFVLDVRKNIFYWNSQGFGGDSIRLVELMKECSFKEAVAYLTETELQEKTTQIEKKRPFHYYMQEHPNIDAVKAYLINERKLSEETVDHFYKAGIIAQATYKNPETNREETVLVFKNKDSSGKIRGVALQGITKTQADPHRPYLKKTLGDGFFGTKITVGNPPLQAEERTKEHPLKIVALEAPIDLMSYYELFHEKLGAGILVAMNGLRKGSVSVAFSEVLFPKASDEQKIEALDHYQKYYRETEKIKIILAVDNDKAGNKFVEEFGIDVCPVVTHQPKLLQGNQKMDWNDQLKAVKRSNQSHFRQKVEQTTKEVVRGKEKVHESRTTTLTKG